MHQLAKEKYTDLDWRIVPPDILWRRRRTIARRLRFLLQAEAKLLRFWYWLGFRLCLT